MTCLDDRRLLEVCFGDAPAGDADHVTACASCAARLRALRRDLARIDTVLRTAPPRPAAHIRLVRRWAPLALAAAVALAVVVHRLPGRSPVDADDDTLALADELTNAMTDDVSFDDAASDPATGPSTCTWGDPLLGVGCDEPAVMRIAWR
jgi:hypothetical protein